MSFSGPLVQVRTGGDQGNDMDLLVGMLQQIGKVVEAAGIFEATGRARKTHRPVLAFTTVNGIRRRSFRIRRRKTTPGAATMFWVLGLIDHPLFLVSHYATLDARVSVCMRKGIGCHTLVFEVAYGQAGSL